MGIAHNVSHFFGDLFDRAKHMTFYAGGKQAGFTLSGLAAGVPGAAAILTMGLASTVSASLIQMDHNRKNRETIDLYRDELASKTTKAGHKLTKKDLQILAEGDLPKGIEPNRVIGEALNKHRRERNLGVVLSVVATLASLAVVALAGPGYLGVLSGAETAVNTAAHMLLGLVAYNVIKTPLHWIGDKMFGLDKETTHERIATLAREHKEGRIISREQVFEVFVQSNPELKSMIQDKYGKPYEELEVPVKQQIAEQLGKIARIDDLTRDINAGAIRVGELAFAVEGQTSGVARGATSITVKPGIFTRMKNGIADMFKGKVEVQAPERVVMDYNADVSTKNFAERFKRSENTLSHVEQVERSRGELGPAQR